MAKPVVVGPNIDFSKRPSKKPEETARGKTYPAFEAYRRAITGNRAPEPSVIGRDGEFITQEEFLKLFRELLAREISASEQELLEKFFLRYAPLPKAAVKDKLEQIVAVAGDRLHLRAYCERILDTIIQTRK